MSDYLALKGLNDGIEAGAEQDKINVVHETINQPKPLYLTVACMLGLGEGRKRQEESCFFIFSFNK